MSSDAQARPADDHLQFDRAVSAGGSASDALACGRCNTPIVESYYHRDGQVLCRGCKQRIEREESARAERGRSASGFVKAALLGLAAAIVGAIIYFAVAEITGWELALVAILIGFMVGAAVRKGASGEGARRYQVLAAALTYFAIGLSYSSSLAKAMIQGEMAGVNADSLFADSTGVGAPAGVGAANGGDAVAGFGDVPVAATAPGAGADSAATVAGTDSALPGGEAEPTGEEIGALMAIGGLLVMIVALPVFVVFGSMPGGLINGLIIAIGLHQAWRMTGDQRVAITGPYRIGTPPPTGVA